MTSPLNNLHTQTFFRQHHLFGLSPQQLDFFCQPIWPLLNEQGQLFLENPHTIAFGPNGNGCIATHLLSSGVWQKWHDMGIKYVSIIPIDNPLALPFDYELLGHHHHQQCDVTIKTTMRDFPEEELGVLVQNHTSHTIRVIEYSEIPPTERYSRNPDQSLTYGFANIGLYCVSMDFLKQAANKPLPLHKAKKRTLHWKHNNSAYGNTWKFEEFIFDLFQYASSCSTLVYPRHECFAPLKHIQGPHSPQHVQQAISIRERNLFAQITGQELPTNTIFELEADFYYPTDIPLCQWENKVLFSS